MKDEEPLFVGVPDPFDLRKGILTSSKDILNSLRRYENFIAIKKEKMKHTVEIVKIMKEISSLTKKLKLEMPKTSAMLKAKPRIEFPEKIIEEKTKLAELESELANVEEKLNRMERR
ncbi:hypothetical protein JW707_00780 [Candidatus Woesearchaeota archaeon]|nr:hypothetical protein [Candidatus Woesearchaeota archaeon]